MHIPDGLLTLKWSAIFCAISALFLVIAIQRTERILKEKNIPMLGVLAAGVFAAQMINYPIPGGTSGHLLGGTLVSIFVGPAGATIVLTVVLVIQCFLFGDGGITALGANILNMAIIGVLTGWIVYYVFTKFFRLKKKAIFLGTFIGSWVSVVLAAFACAFEIGLSGTIPFRVGIPVMVGWHIFIGIGEALISSFIVSFVLVSRPDLVKNFSRGVSA